MSIRKAVIAQAERLGLTAYAIAHESKKGGQFQVSVNHVQEYLANKTDMTSAKLDAVFGVLGLEVKPKGKVKDESSDDKPTLGVVDSSSPEAVGK